MTPFEGAPADAGGVALDSKLGDPLGARQTGTQAIEGFHPKVLNFIRRKASTVLDRCTARGLSLGRR